MHVSIIIRTLNESRWLGNLLKSVGEQAKHGITCEVVVVDSGSTDGTLDIAKEHGCRIVRISQKDFSFGRSLNCGCEVASGDILVFISGHCVPVDASWLCKLCTPIIEGKAEYVYGRQIGGPSTRFSECQIFKKYFPEKSAVPQEGIYCNNANAAISTYVWRQYRFNEELTGLEDMELANRLALNELQVAYVAEAIVHHHHDETWRQVRRRFEREAIALQFIMPQIQISKTDLGKFIVTSVFKDCVHALKLRKLFGHFREIVCYRVMQYVGVYVGSNEHRKLAQQEKNKYYYPE